MKMNMLAIETKFLQPLDTVSGFGVRPGFYEMNGATKLSCGVNFTIHSQNATSCELLLFHRGERSHMRYCRFRRTIGSGGCIR